MPLGGQPALADRDHADLDVGERLEAHRPRTHAPEAAMLEAARTQEAGRIRDRVASGGDTDRLGRSVKIHGLNIMEDTGGVKHD
ncbi:hypothetical protein GCM10022227_21630 [Streptomyces sedi]